MDQASKNNLSELGETGWTYIRFVIDTVREPFIVLGSELRVIFANEAFYRMFLVTPDETEGKIVFDLGNGQWNSPQLRRLLEDILPKSTFFKDFDVEYEFPLIGRKVMMVNARIVYAKDSSAPYVIMAIEDVTKQKLLEEKLKSYAKELEIKVLERTHELEKRIGDLEKLNDTMIDRELKMVELKKEIIELKVKP